MELALKYRTGIWGRLMAEDAPDLSDETLDRVLGSCVGGTWLPACAKLLRDSDNLHLVDHPPYERDRR